MLLHSVGSARNNKQNMDSTRRHSISSTSACKQMLRSLCDDNAKLARDKDKEGEVNASTIREYKLQETINYLSKKNGKQMEDIIALTENLNKVAQLREKEVAEFTQELAKMHKIQADNNIHIANMNKLKKKVSVLEKEKEELKKEYTDFETKLIKIKAILRSKQSAIEELENKLAKTYTLDDQLELQNKQIKKLKQTEEKLASNKEKIEEENRALRAKVAKLQNQNKQVKQECWILQQCNSRLKCQCEQIERAYQNLNLESNNAIEDLKQIIYQQNQECSNLRGCLEKVKKAQLDQNSNQFSHFYKNQIQQMLRINIGDPKLRSKMESKIFQIMLSMEEAMNNVLLQVIADHQ